MKRNVNKWFGTKQSLTFLMVVCMLPYQQLLAQNRKVGSGKQGGGNATRVAPSGNRPLTNNRPSANKPDIQRPAGNNNALNRPDAKKPGANNNASNRPDVKRPGGNNEGGIKNNVSNSGNRTNNIGSNNKKVNIDNSKRNVNVNVNNSKNVRVNNSRYTSVRRSPNYRPYGRPPYRYGGYRYNCYHPYYYHPYRPFIWGPRWHPWGFFVTTLAATAIILSVDNNVPHNVDLAYIPVVDNSYYLLQMQMPSGPALIPYTDGPEDRNYQTGTADTAITDEYYYDEGVYYLKGDGGYTVVAAPLGVSIKALPTGYETITLDDKTVNYYFGGTFYEKSAKGYTVVAPTAGAVVANVSEGGKDTKIGEITYVKLGDTYYQPIQQDGKDMYEVADVEEDK